MNLTELKDPAEKAGKSKVSYELKLNVADSTFTFSNNKWEELDLDNKVAKRWLENNATVISLSSFEVASNWDKVFLKKKEGAENKSKSFKNVDLVNDLIKWEIITGKEEETVYLYLIFEGTLNDADYYTIWNVANKRPDEKEEEIINLAVNNQTNDVVDLLWVNNSPVISTPNNNNEALMEAVVREVSEPVNNTNF